VTSRRRQPTTGQGRIVRQPVNPFVSRGVPALLSRANRAASTRGVPAAAAGGATASTAAVTPYSVSNLPPDAAWAKIAGPGGLLDQQRIANLAAISGERTRSLSDYGFNEGPNGALAYDPNNPFSKASVLKKAYDTNRRSTAQSMGAGGQLYSGAFQNAQDLVNRNELQAGDTQLKALQAFLASNTGRSKQEEIDYQTGAANAWSDRLARFQDNPLYDPSSGTWKTPEPEAAAPAGPVTGPNSAAAGAAAPRTTKVAVSAKYGGRWLYEKRGKDWVPIRRMF